MANVTRANVQRCVGRLQGLEPILSERFARKEIKIVGAVYDLATGKVDVFC